MQKLGHFHFLKTQPSKNLKMSSHFCGKVKYPVNTKDVYAVIYTVPIN